MDRFGEWRPIEPAATDDGDEPSSKSAPAKAAEPARPEANVLNVRLAGLLCAGALAAIGAFVWLGAGTGTPSLQLNGAAAVAFVPTASSDLVVAIATLDPSVVVDVEGAVVRPGIHRLPTGSRVGDAIAAAGGYSPQVDIAAAAEQLNLAAPLVDGGKVHVPARGEAAMGSLPSNPAGNGNDGGSGGLIDVNTASSEDLDTLPGIGPVTAAKIIDARSSTPFATVDELLSREVVGAATLEKIRDLITVGP